MIFLFEVTKYSPVFDSDQRIHLWSLIWDLKRDNFKSQGLYEFLGVYFKHEGRNDEKRLIFANLRSSRERSSSLFQARYSNCEMLWGWDIILPFLIGIPGFFWQTQTVCVSCFEFFSRTPLARFPFKDFLVFLFRTRLLRHFSHIKTSMGWEHLFMLLKWDQNKWPQDSGC